VGLGKALEIILSVKDFDADQAEKYGTINKALDADAIDGYVATLARLVMRRRNNTKKREYA
jgi:enoyl-CoA hydratase/carnithine racemase